MYRLDVTVAALGPPATSQCCVPLMLGHIEVKVKWKCSTIRYFLTRTWFWLWHVPFALTGLPAHSSNLCQKSERQYVPPTNWEGQAPPHGQKAPSMLSGATHKSLGSLAAAVQAHDDWWQNKWNPFCFFSHGMSGFLHVLINVIDVWLYEDMTGGYKECRELWLQHVQKLIFLFRKTFWNEIHDLM